MRCAHVAVVASSVARIIKHGGHACQSAKIYKYNQKEKGAGGKERNGINAAASSSPSQCKASSQRAKHQARWIGMADGDNANSRIVRLARGTACATHQLWSHNRNPAIVGLCDNLWLCTNRIIQFVPCVKVVMASFNAGHNVSMQRLAN